MRLPGAGPGFLRAVASALLARRPEGIAVLVGEEGEPLAGCYLVQAGPAGPPDVATIGERVRAALGARGGGSGRLHQGKGGRTIGGASEIELAINPRRPERT